MATFRLEYEDDYEYELTILSMRFRLEGRVLRTLNSFSSSYSNLKVAIVDLLSKGAVHNDDKRVAL